MGNLYLYHAHFKGGSNHSLVVSSDCHGKTVSLTVNSFIGMCNGAYVLQSSIAIYVLLGCMGKLHVFPPSYDREITFVTSCLLSWTTKPFQNGVYS